MQLRTLRKSALASFAVVTAACGDEHDHEHDHSGFSETCLEIVEACHPVDDGSGEPHDCHEMAHSGNPAACEAELEACLAACGASGS